MPINTSLVVPCLISAPISDLIVFSPFMAAAYSYISPIYRVLDF